MAAAVEGERGGGGFANSEWETRPARGERFGEGEGKDAPVYSTGVLVSARGASPGPPIADIWTHRSVGVLALIGPRLGTSCLGKRG